MTGEKTEKATPKRRKEARKEGQVARTPELGSWAALLLATIALPGLVRHEITAFEVLMSDALRSIQDPTIPQAMRLLREGGTHAFISLVVLGSGVMVVGVAAALAQGGFFLATKLVKPSAKKLNPVSGFKRLFGPHALWEGLKTLVKSAAVGLLFWLTLRSMLPVVGAHAGADALLAHTGDQAVALARNIALAGLAMAALDYAWQRRKTSKQTKMSKEDVKQEHRQSEGDPLVKSAIRARQLAAARNRMIADIPEADVVLVNPTHVAVALRYDAASGAPRVVARGAGVIAAKIREVATEARVPLVRDVPLARALYASTEVGHEIPAELFAAVAQVLAFVINRRNLGQRGGEHRSPRRETELSAPARHARRRHAAGGHRGPRREQALPAASPGRRADSSGRVLAGR
ncbi:EscU/YscU/HrcU family type III secretion system export apparatus switch protein [Nocardioides anomalus]|uniref:EscU/YscU/HrcU family type III secretion system export apparatus switch protein n=1 Tax=Nocardioides anomalus TaxID=2712223 RepID=A0A6G6WAS9_9ACTN|nr:EscU/YscU/HrcU family type III secretion system export apparatus switch protein [Nocardioides anomalus]QIG42451.1 EscU/YscU/HrcU family type III secretion system export apparatus switch protein [Nocardioides anomalus]